MTFARKPILRDNSEKLDFQMVVMLNPENRLFSQADPGYFFHEKFKMDGYKLKKLIFKLEGR